MGKLFAMFFALLMPDVGPIILATLEKRARVKSQAKQVRGIRILLAMMRFKPASVKVEWII